MPRLDTVTPTLLIHGMWPSQVTIGRGRSGLTAVTEPGQRLGLGRLFAQIPALGVWAGSPRAPRAARSRERHSRVGDRAGPVGRGHGRGLGRGRLWAGPRRAMGGGSGRGRAVCGAGAVSFTPAGGSAFGVGAKAMRDCDSSPGHGRLAPWGHREQARGGGGGSHPNRPGGPCDPRRHSASRLPVCGVSARRAQTTPRPRGAPDVPHAQWRVDKGHCAPAVPINGGGLGEESLEAPPPTAPTWPRTHTPRPHDGPSPGGGRLGEAVGWGLGWQRPHPSAGPRAAEGRARGPRAVARGLASAAAGSLRTC